MARLLENVDEAVGDAAAALLRAEQNREAALAAMRAADADVDEAREVFERLQRLRASLADEDDSARSLRRVAAANAPVEWSRVFAASCVAPGRC